SVPRQDPQLDSGRANQKRRTRAAIVSAARELFADGITPTVAQAAEHALVSRTTAYRYFPTQDTLLLEIGIDAGVDELEARAAAPRNAGEAPTDLVQIISALNGLVLENEAQYRRMLQLYLEVWLRATENDDVEPVVRQGRRMRWFEQILEPVRASVDPASFDRLLAALCLTAGSEAVVALRDVARLSPADVVETTAWVTQVLVDATFADPA
ncbi:MAG TPA: TetR/AcrR family transcriptional regulator, partial [Acidimicrobiia bacterium]|nr:TetR/AcrR family transcriptional regulator [Acidimicrobiia bacterium]